MWSEEVVVGDPESEIEIGIFETVIATGASVGSLESAVEPLDHLLERSELCRDIIIVGEADDLSDVEVEVFTILEIELHSSKRIRAVAVGDKSETSRELFTEVFKGLTHREDAGTNTPVVRASVTEDRTLHSIHDQPDIAFDATNFDVCLICCEVTGRLVVVVVYERLDENCSSLTVICDLLMRDPDAVNVPQNVFGTTERYLVVDVVCET